MTNSSMFAITGRVIKEIAVLIVIDKAVSDSLSLNLADNTDTNTITGIALYIIILLRAISPMDDEKIVKTFSVIKPITSDTIIINQTEMTS